MAGRWWWWGLLQGLLAALLFAARHAEAISSTAGTPGVQVTSRDPLVDQVPTLADEFARVNPPLLSKARWLSLALSDVFLVATCRSEDSAAFNFCVSRSDKVRHDCPPFSQIQNWVGRSFDADVTPPTPFFVSLFFFPGKNFQEAESGDCRTKHGRSFSSRRLIVFLKGTELCNRNPVADTLRLLVLGSHASAPEDPGGNLRCHIPVSPYRPHNATVRVSGRARAECSLAVEDEISAFRLAAVASGVTLIVLAPGFSRSLPFRVGLGAAFAVVFALVLAVYYCSKRPRLTVVSSAFLGLAALNQSWWRSFLNTERMQQAAVVYCLASACGGAAVSYYFDSALSTGRATSLVAASFQVTGVLLIYANCQSYLLTAVLVTAAFFAHVLTLDVVSGALVTSARTAAKVGEVVLSPLSSPVRSPRLPAAAAEAKSPASPRRKKAFSPFRASAEKSVPRRRSSAAAMTPVQPKESPRGGSKDSSQIAHCVQRGMIMNEETSRLIKIGKGTYNKLVEKGWEVDETAGVISPPTKRKS